MKPETETTDQFDTQLLQRLFDLGASVMVQTPGLDTPWMEIASIDRVLAYCRDPQKFLADEYSVSVAELNEYYRTHGIVRCTAKTVKGRCCKNIAVDGDKAHDLSGFAELLRTDPVCQLHR